MEDARAVPTIRLFLRYLIMEDERDDLNFQASPAVPNHGSGTSSWKTSGVVPTIRLALRYLNMTDERGGPNYQVRSAVPNHGRRVGRSELSSYSCDTYSWKTSGAVPYYQISCGTL